MIDTECMENIAEAWVNFNRLAIDANERDLLTGVLDEVDGIIQRDPGEGWEFIEAVRRMDVDAHLLSNLAAGPLEDYLVVHGEVEIERVECLAKHDPSLRDLLAQTWKNSMSDEVWRRVQRAATSG
ncbi:hypothetical protein A9K58_17820 [Stenotrophomonas maltophilia]|uniref:DUF6869 domain-containing protein n=2 Tax=Stenotrophomonas maltophilia TaxID=40324 RepID=A0A1A6XL38_STEMA|nr:hypothetical protein A9K58_17820 [Stenotrophomonas maltophilia]